MPIEIDIRDLGDADRAACKAFDCGSYPWSEEVNDYIRRVYWIPGRPREQGLIADVRGEQHEMFGFGTWKHLSSTKTGEDEVVIRIAFFGVAVQYQGARNAEGIRCAEVLYSTLEHDARTHQDSTDEMQLELFCDTENARGLSFWQGLGYQEIDRSPGRERQEQYYRMRRN